ncbi:hydroxymethylbilane synthase [Clostridium fermenticellae]|uniref:Porphobilinogen deaminase n=1 Tax=Clostridium fermenticellae TaxID=2068654 RepID=A0A386H5Q0_9CLOT|nr:hydroxymethylbilane synthase [Clostridium fermenticellae]AYD41039.1 hydroxymethylbilane synthase [Clostridium fermenticellae]
MRLKIASRKSKLAQIQTEIVMKMLKEKYNILSEKVLMNTMGDKLRDVSLSEIGGKGLFIKEIEDALIKDETDAAVHSMKDIPFDVPPSFEIIAVLKREDPRDAFISSTDISFNNLKKGAVVGTSSNRRSAQLKCLRPDIRIVPLRGNVQTRIRKMKDQNLDGIILAVSGLKRMNMDYMITDYFKLDEMIPAVGQGALGIEIKKGNKNEKILKSLSDYESEICVEAERSFMRRLNGDCKSTIGANALIQGNIMHITGIFYINNRLIKKDISGNKEDYIYLGRKLAEKIIEA